MILKFRVYEQTISLQATKSEPRQGSRDYLELQFSFSSDWNDLLKYVYLQHGEVSVPHDLTEGSIIVDEYFTEQTEFNVTLFGRSADGSVEVPTNVVTVFLKESNNLWEKDAPAPQNSWVVQVVDARDEALAAAIRAENAAIHQPYPNAETGTWWVWDADSGAYKDTGVSAAGGNGKSAYQYAVDGGYTKTEAEFAEKLAQEPLIGTTDELTPTQVYDAVSAGIPVKVQYTDSTYGLLSFTAFNVAESLNLIVSQTIVYGNVCLLAELIGYKSDNTWVTAFTILAQKTDIPSALPNPNALTFTGAVTGSYDGSAPLNVKIPGSVTDAHINSLIDTKLGVIENGSY